MSLFFYEVTFFGKFLFLSIVVVYRYVGFDTEATQTEKKPFNRTEYMRNYMRIYMKNITKKEKMKKQVVQELMLNVIDTLIAIVNANIDNLDGETIARIAMICDTK